MSNTCSYLPPSSAVLSACHFHFTTVKINTIKASILGFKYAHMYWLQSIFMPYFSKIEEKLNNNTYIVFSLCHFDSQVPRYWSNTLDTFTQMLIGYHITQIFSRPLSHYFHWSPGHMAIYKLLLANYHSRKHVTSHMIVMSKSPIIKRISRLILCVCNL